MCSQFYGVKDRASNTVSANTDEYEIEMFIADFPQFTKKCEDGTRELLVPQSMLDQILVETNSVILKSRWFEKWRRIAGLYTAHYVTLYLESFADSSETAAEAASSGAVLGTVKSASVDDASVTYDTGAVVKGTEKWGNWNATKYGQQLASEARLYGLGGTLVI